MADIENKPVDTKTTQKKQGFFEIRRLKLIKLNASEIIGADIRTSEGGNRVQLSTQNELGFPQEGLYLYNGGNIATSLSQNSIFFYNNDGTLKAAVQMPTDGNLGISADTVLITHSLGGASIEVDANGITMTGVPTSNPGGSGRIWSDGGTLKIT